VFGDPKDSRREKGEINYGLQNKTSATTDALCSILEATGRLTGSVKNIENNTSEINLLRREILLLHTKVDKMVELLAALIECGKF